MLFGSKNGTSFYRFLNLAGWGGIDHRIFTRRNGFSLLQNERGEKLS